LDYVLGVDAGNTKTVTLVGALDGTIHGVGRGGCGDIYGAVSAEAALSEIEGAVTQALGMAGVLPGALGVGAFSLAGADWPEDFEFLRAEMEERGFGGQVIVVNDALGALRAGTPDGTGVVIACGTGTAIGARSPSGLAWHTSHWQEPHGSHHMSMKALRAIYRADLGIDPPTALTPALLTYFGKESVEEILHIFSARLAKPQVNWGALARILLEAAQAGDATALRLVREHGEGLGDYALAAARKVGIEGTPFTLALAGGVLRHPSPVMPDAIVARVRTTSPEVTVVNSRFEPVVGALFLALEAAGVAIDEPLLARLVPTLPPSSLFET
jgi:N-acetylglucosamine kinase-like BadF-type ATPase